MRVDVGQARSHETPAENDPNAARVKAPRAPVLPRAEEDAVGNRLLQQVRTHLVQIGLEVGRHPLAHGDDPLFSSFAHQAQRSPWQDVLRTEADELTDAGPAAVRDRQKAAIPDGHRIITDDGLQQAPHVVGLHEPREPASPFRDGQGPERVDRDLAARHQMLPKAARGGDPSLNARPSETRIHQTAQPRPQHRGGDHVPLRHALVKQGLKQSCHVAFVRINGMLSPLRLKTLDRFFPATAFDGRLQSRIPNTRSQRNWIKSVRILLKPNMV